MRSKRQNPRTFFYEGLPAVLFFIKDKTYSGFISDRSRNGLGIITSDSTLDVIPGDVISRIYIGKPENEYVVEELKIAYISYDESEGNYRLGIYADSEEIANRLNKVMHQATEERVSFGAEEFKNTKIPYFGGQEHYSTTAIETRLKWLQEVTKTKIEYLPQSILEPRALAGNIENYIGAVQIPIGISGPILVKGTYTDDYIPIPIATIEGALVSSLNRGIKVCNLAGGIRTQVTRQSMVRAPVFFCNDLAGAVNLERWVHNNMKFIIDKAESVSSVAQLISIEPFIFGNALHLRFSYQTGDAAGQNMTTACTWYACEWIADKIAGDNSIGFDYYMIEGNMSGDKKINFQNIIKGRGIAVVAEVIIPEQILQKILRVSAKEMANGWSAAEAGGMRIGMIGSNVNFANVIAGIFVSTGQDIASIHESSLGIIKMIEEDGNLRVHAYLPSLVIGTVGSGTNLPVQKECLNIMGCDGQGKVYRLAEIIAASCLALDISTAAAISTNEFVSAHERLGRNRPKAALSKSKLNAQFFTKLLNSKDRVITFVEELPIINNQGIVSTILDKKRNGIKGIFKYHLKAKSPKQEKEDNFTAILKLKSSDKEIINIGLGLSRLSGQDRLPGLFEANLNIFGFNDSHLREIEFYRNMTPEIARFCPNILGTGFDERRNIFAILMEDLSDTSHFNTVDDPSFWDDSSIKTALEQLADFHSVYFQKPEDIPVEIKVNQFDPDTLLEAGEFLTTLTQYNANRFPELISGKLLKIFQNYFENNVEAYELMLKTPMTLTHNDCNPRNLCFKEENDEIKLILYDWELPCFQNPQHDLIEFLSFTLPENTPLHLFTDYAIYYCQQIEKKVGRRFLKKSFLDALYINALDLATVRFNLYLLAHNIVKFSFLKRVYKNLGNFIENFSAKTSFLG